MPNLSQERTEKGIFISFKYKILGLFSALIIGILGTILIVVNQIYRARAVEMIESDLKRTHLIFIRLLDERNLQLAASARLLSLDFAFKQAVATEEHATVLSAARNHQKRIGSDLFIVTDRYGTVLADTSSWKQFGDDISDEPWIQQVLSEGEGMSLSLIKGSLYQIISLPLIAPDVIGTLSLGFRIDSSVAAHLRKTALAQISFLVGTRVIASTLGDDARQDLERQLETPNFGKGKSSDLFRLDLATGVERERFLSIFGSINLSPMDFENDEDASDPPGGTSDEPNLQQLKELLLKVRFQPSADINALATLQSLQAGRSLLLKKCIPCHAMQKMLGHSEKTPAAWYAAVQTMGQKTAESLLLFSTESPPQSENSDSLLLSLRRPFKKNGIPLSPDATISASNVSGAKSPRWVEAGSATRWLITDKKERQAYIVRKENGKLKIYLSPMIWPPITQREAALVTAYLISFTLGLQVAGAEIEAEFYTEAEAQESDTAASDSSETLRAFSDAEAKNSTEETDTSEMLNAFEDTGIEDDTEKTDTSEMLNAFGDAEAEDDTETAKLLNAFGDSRNESNTADGVPGQGVDQGESAGVTAALTDTSAGAGVALSYLIQDSLDEALKPLKTFQRILLFIGIGAIAIGVGFALAIATGVTSAVRQLAKGTEEVVEGNYEYRLNITQRDEIGQLANHFNAMVAGLRDREKIRAVMDKVVSKEIAEELLRGEVQLGGEMRRCTVLFSDIRGWTAISERLAPEALVEMLNGYLTVMSEAIDDELGVIDKYIGDAIVALFGAPVSYPDDIQRSVDAALEMRRRLVALNAEREKNGEFPLETGIGINTGPVLAGNIGSESRLNYTVMGDTVNLASRLEGLTKLYGSGIIVPDAIRNELSPDYLCRELDLIQVKGKNEAVRIFEVLTHRADKDLAQLAECFESGLASYRRQDWDGAEAAFTQTLGRFRNDLSSKLYLDRIQSFRTSPPPPDWDGVFVATEKYGDDE